jgi:single-strand DNA-binding protein
MSVITLSGSVYGRGKDEDVSEALRYSASGTAYVNFRLAAYGGKEKDKVYWTCVAFGELAEHIAASCTNGSRLLISGRVESNNWEDKDGNKRYDTQVIVNDAGVDLRFGPAQSFDTRDATPSEPKGGWGNVAKPKARDDYGPEEAPF